MEVVFLRLKAASVQNCSIFWLDDRSKVAWLGRSTAYTQQTHFFDDRSMRRTVARTNAIAVALIETIICNPYMSNSKHILQQFLHDRTTT